MTPKGDYVGGTNAIFTVTMKYVRYGRHIQAYRTKSCTITIILSEDLADGCKGGRIGIVYSSDTRSSCAWKKFRPLYNQVSGYNL